MASASETLLVDLGNSDAPTSTSTSVKSFLLQPGGAPPSPARSWVVVVVVVEGVGGVVTGLLLHSSSPDSVFNTAGREERASQAGR